MTDVCNAFSQGVDGQSLGLFDFVKRKYFMHGAMTPRQKACRHELPRQNSTHECRWAKNIENLA